MVYVNRAIIHNNRITIKIKLKFIIYILVKIQNWQHVLKSYNVRFFFKTFQK